MKLLTIAVLATKKTYWWFRIVLLSLRWIPSFNLGDYVWYHGEKWMLIQGVCNPCWDLLRGEERKNHIHQLEFCKVRTISNYWHGFNSGYRFYMGYWFDIWVNAGIEPWMLGCNIWKGKH